MCHHKRLTISLQRSGKRGGPAQHARTMNCARLALVGCFIVNQVFAQTVDYRHAPGSPLKIPGGGHNFVVGDVDKDGHVDLVIVERDKLTVMLGDGKGGFTAAPVPATSVTGVGGEM